MEGDYNIIVKSGSQPFAVSIPGHISLPFLPKVKDRTSFRRATTFQIQFNSIVNFPKQGRSHNFELFDDLDLQD